MKPFFLVLGLCLSTCLLPEVVHPFSITPNAPFLLQVQNKKSSPSASEAPADDSSKTAEPKSVTSPAVTLKLAYMADPGLFPYDIECHIQEKTIELTGVVAIEEEKALATALTKQVIRGKDIVNNIEVQPALRATLQTTADRRLTELIKKRFAESQTLREANFEVVTIRGMVSLRGLTRFQVIALEAAQATREIPGVMAVDTRNIRLEGENE